MSYEDYLSEYEKRAKKLAARTSKATQAQPQPPAKNPSEMQAMEQYKRYLQVCYLYFCLFFFGFRVKGFPKS